MKINVADLQKNNLKNKSIDIEENFEEIEINGDSIKFLEPVRLKGEMTNNNGIFLLNGSIQAKLGLNCHRCSKSFEYSAEISINERYIQSEKPDDDFYGFKGKEIDLNSMVMDNILLNIPMKIVCSEKCKGLCEICGCNKNEKECGCTLESRNWNIESRIKINPDSRV